MDVEELEECSVVGTKGVGGACGGRKGERLAGD
jgi:hypothetical protein